MHGSTPSPLSSGPTPPLNTSMNNGPLSSVSTNSPGGYSMMGQKRPVAGGSLDSAGSSSEVLDRKRLQELVKEVDPNEQLDEDVETMLLQIADDFIEQTVSSACAMAKHRKANNIQVEDVQVQKLSLTIVVVNEGRPIHIE